MTLLQEISKEVSKLDRPDDTDLQVVLVQNPHLVFRLDEIVQAANVKLIERRLDCLEEQGIIKRKNRVDWAWACGLPTVSYEYHLADAAKKRKPLPTHVRDWAESAVKVLMDVHQTECAEAVRELLRRAGG